MKKIKTLGIITMVVLFLIISAVAALAALGFFKIQMGETNLGEIILFPEKNKNKALAWQTEETEGDVTAVFKTDLGDFEVKLGDCAASEKFIELDNAGVFDGMEFSVLAENMFIQTSLSGEGFSMEKNDFACVEGAVAFVFEDEKAFPSVVIITAENLSTVSKAYVKEIGMDEERTKTYEEFGGVPEYEENLVVFGKISSGKGVIKAISEGKNSGYTGGYSALEPVKINSVEISFPTEQN